MSERLSLAGEAGPVFIVRDSFGVPHVRAETAAGAWHGMGYACAQDRMFQMDYDRRRAAGRLAEIAGPKAVSGDILARRLGLVAAAKRDVGAMSGPLRSALEAYAAGVNHALTEGLSTFEESAAGYRMEPWQPWHCVAVYKIRHALMGLWQRKLAEAVLLSRIGLDAFRRLETRSPIGSPLAVPPDERLTRLIADALGGADLPLGFLVEAEADSNAWAVSAAKTSHGAAVLCSDSHRGLDTPNVYWQCHVSCPDFNVVGGTFPGLPGFPHFGHNGQVAWAITHADADAQDLYLEKFDGDRYLTEDGWKQAAVRTERIEVRGKGTEEVEVFHTRHGPVVHGDPRRGIAIALKYTSLSRADRGLECMLPMLTARDARELVSAQEGWVDPVNNLVAADTGGHIAYQCRGELPVRASQAHRRLPVPGWDGKCEWVGTVPFDQMPQAVDPEPGFVLTANNVIVDGDQPYISYTFAQPFRAERLRTLLAETSAHHAGDLAAMQTDSVSWSAQAWSRVFAGLAYADTTAEAARRMLADWDGDLRADSGQALLFACFQRALAEDLYRPVVGGAVWDWITSGTVPPLIALVSRWLANDTWELLGGPLPPAEHCGPADPGISGRERSREVLTALPRALASGWAAAARTGGRDPSDWQWGRTHQAVRTHPLGDCLDASLLPPVPMGGDADTIQAGAYEWRQNDPFTAVGLSVYRQVIDLADPSTASYVIPGGSSGDPRSPHFDDQLSIWAECRRIPMLYPWPDIGVGGP